jgi:hypothetical protein
MRTQGGLVAARLGEVLYWAACAVAGLLALAAIAVFVAATSGDWTATIMLGALAALVWLFGRACLYVLAGR